MGSRATTLISVALLLLGVALFGATRASGPEVAAASEVAVSITPSGFRPQEITVDAGTTVTWTNDSGTPQTV
ncbi:MAG: amicyanin, partial [Dehalococcoidia bacterium]